MNNNLKKNSPEALFTALELGFGIETDIRDGENELEIRHDPFEKGWSFEKLLIEFVKQNKLIDWNSEETSEIINSCAKIKQCFYLSMIYTLIIGKMITRNNNNSHIKLLITFFSSSLTTKRNQKTG